MTFEKALKDFVITSCQIGNKTYYSLSQFDSKSYMQKEGKLMVDNKSEGFIFIFDNNEVQE